MVVKAVNTSSGITSEVRFKVEQALRIMPRMTIGALQSFITSRVSHVAREAVLKQMEEEGLVRVFNQDIVSFRGYTSTVRMVEKVNLRSATELARYAARNGGKLPTNDAVETATVEVNAE